MQERESETSFYDFFVPFTTRKAIIFISIIGLIVYCNALFNGFVWDDFGYILLNGQVHSLQNIFQSFGPNIFNQLGQYRPLDFIYFVILYGLFKEVAFFYHFLGIFLHILNAILVFLCFKKLFTHKLSFFLSVLFLVHPMQVESSTFIATSGDRLFFLFGIAALYLSLKEVITLKRALVISMLLLLSLLSKETGVLFLAMILLYVLAKKKNRKLFFYIGGAAAACYLILRFFVGKVSLGHTLSMVPIAHLSLWARLANVPEIILYYLKTFLFPWDLMIMQLWTIPYINFQYFYLPIVLDLLFLCIFGYFGYYLYQKNKQTLNAFVFFMIWFCLGMIIHIQILPLDMTVADRWFYFPMVGLLGAGGVVLQQYMKHRHGYMKMSIVYCGIIILVFLSLRTIVRNQDWQNVYTLYTHDGRLADNFMIENNLGWYYQMNKDFIEASKHYRRSVDLYSVGPNVSNLINIYSILGNKDQTKEYSYKLLTVEDNSVEIFNQHLSLAGWTLLENNSPQDAADFMKKALEKNPTSAPLWAYLAICEYRLNNYPLALQYSEKARKFSSRPPYRELYDIIKNKKVMPTEISLLI